jgi:hypothetical protein
MTISSPQYNPITIQKTLCLTRNEFTTEEKTLQMDRFVAPSRDDALEAMVLGNSYARVPCCCPEKHNATHPKQQTDKVHSLLYFILEPRRL